jgi:sugar lactone lactonase YvrE
MNDATVLYFPELEEDRFLPEGPRSLHWQGRDALIWVNIQTSINSETGSLHVRFWDTGEVLRFPMPGRPGFVIPTPKPGQLLVGMNKQVGIYELDTLTWTPLAQIPDPEPRTIINDGEPVLDSSTIIFGTKDTHFTDRIAEIYLFRLLPRPTISKVRGGQLCSNGKVIQETFEGLMVYDIDTPSKMVTRNRLDLDAGMLVEMGMAIDLRGEADFPDGMIDGGDDTVIIAFYNPAEVSNGRAVRYDLYSGKAVESWRIPGSPRVTCPLLVQRPEGMKLIFTTATEGMPAEWREKCPEAGSLFWATPSGSSA